MEVLRTPQPYWIDPFPEFVDVGKSASSSADDSPETESDDDVEFLELEKPPHSSTGKCGSKQPCQTLIQSGGMLVNNTRLKVVSANLHYERRRGDGGDQSGDDSCDAETPLRLMDEKKSPAGTSFIPRRMRTSYDPPLDLKPSEAVMGNNCSEKIFHEISKSINKTCVAESELPMQLTSIRPRVAAGPSPVKSRVESPTNLKVKLITSSTAVVIWTAQHHTSSYHVYYWTKEKHRESAEICISKNPNCRLKLKPETTYLINVVAVSSNGQWESAPSEIVELSTGVQIVRFAENLVKWCQKIAKKNEMEFYAVPLAKLDESTSTIKRFTVGKADCKNNLNHKTVLLVGKSGSGKTTLINAIINYVFNVEWQDSFRFQLPEYCDNKKCISVYDIHKDEGFRIPFCLTIIDTPGYGERGLDREVTDMIRNFVFNSNVPVDFNMIGFVAKSSMPRDIDTQLNVYDSLLSSFGNEVKEKINFLLNFADEQIPPVINFFVKARLPFPISVGSKEPLYHKFNSSGLFCCNREPKPNHRDMAKYEFNRGYWDMNTESFRRFFDVLMQF